MQASRILLLFSLLLTLCVSCDEKASYLPASSGKVGDVLLVAHQPVLEGPCKALIDSVLGRDEIGLPRPEPLYNIADCNLQGYSPTLKLHRNIIEITIDPSAEGRIRVRRNLYSNQQLIFQITAANEQQLYSILQSGIGDIERKIQMTELARLRRKFEELGDGRLSADLQAQEGFSLAFEPGYELVRKVDNVRWYMRDSYGSVGGFKHQVSQGILVYSQPYSDTSDFNPSVLLNLKDSLSKMMIQGTRDGSYMVSSPYKRPILKAYEWNGHYSAQITGLWRMHKDNMGGPYLLFSIHDPDKQRIVHLMGYVFAPQFEKRPHLMAVEAVLKSIAFDR